MPIDTQAIVKAAVENALRSVRAESARKSAPGRVYTDKMQRTDASTKSRSTPPTQKPTPTPAATEPDSYATTAARVPQYVKIGGNTVSVAVASKAASLKSVPKHGAIGAALGAALKNDRPETRRARDADCTQMAHDLASSKTTRMPTRSEIERVAGDRNVRGVEEVKACMQATRLIRSGQLPE